MPSTRANQYRLVNERRFLPLFLAQGCGALNDNLLKCALALFIAYRAAGWSHLQPQMLATIASGLYILPSVLFSGLAAQLAERYDKSRLLKCVKAFEVGIMAVAAVGLEQQQVGLLLGALFLMGLHSTCRAPANYALLPQILRSAELVGGNALLQTATFLAIPLATLAAVPLAVRGNPALTGAGLLSIAIAGFLVSLAIPESAAVAPDLRFNWNPFTASLENWRAARNSRTVLLSVLGLSWFWFYSAFVLIQLPSYCRAVLHGDAAVVTLTISVFALGVGIGSLMCERLSGGQIEIGLVPFGSFGLTLFALDWVWGSPHPNPSRVIDLPGLMALPGGWRVIFDIGALGVFGGLFAVPLNALVQQRSSPRSLPRIIGANSLLNALFMVAAALLGAAGLARGLTVLQSIVIAAVLNAAVALYIYHLVPEFLLRFMSWLLVHTLYRLHESDADQFPETGAALIVSNHVSFVDALVISAACRRPIHFIMDEAIFNAPVIRTLAKGMKAIPIASAKDDEAILEHAFELTAAALRDGGLVCIFPEGRLTRDGGIGVFRPGMMRILHDMPVPVIPIAIVGLWGSMFSKQAARVWQRLPRKLGARIAVNVGESIDPQNVSPEGLRRSVQAQFDR